VPETRTSYRGRKQVEPESYMSMQDTSLHVYRYKVEPTLQERERPVYELLLSSDNLTNAEIAVKLDWPINCVTGRTNRLCNKLKLIYVDEKRRCRVTGNTAMAYKAFKDTLF